MIMNYKGPLRRLLLYFIYVYTPNIILNYCFICFVIVILFTYCALLKNLKYKECFFQFL